MAKTKKVTMKIDSEIHHKLKMFAVKNRINILEDAIGLLLKKVK